MPKNVTGLVTVEERQGLVTRMIETFQNVLRYGGLDANLVNEIAMLAELEHWQNYCIRSDNTNMLQGDAIDVLNACDKDIYPIIFKLLQILCTLPVINSTGERSCSTWRLIKMWLRTTMLQKRLTGLALMSVHHSIDLQAADVVIDQFAKMSTNKSTRITL